MSLSSHVLFDHLCSDLSEVLPTVPYLSLFSGKTRELEWPGITGRQVASLALLDSLLKKFEDEKTSDADGAALSKFLACNSRCESFRSIDVSQLSEIQAVALGEFQKSIYDFWFQPNRDYWLSPEKISEGFAVGPGASVGATGDSFYHKVAAGPMTGTYSSLYSLYQREVSKFPLWDEAEKIRQTHFGGFQEVQGARLSFVPKSREISRTICTEPVLNMFVQKGLGRLLELELESRFGINLATQPDKNRRLADIGSKCGAFGTIDLSSASDTVSINLLRQILPNYVRSWLMECRSGKVQLPNGEVRKLHMVSSMGNAFTFPLQTILFSSVVIGVYKALDLELVYPRGDDLGTFAVFGDDIVVRREAYDLVVNILGRLGFEVNREKSFNLGPFRESCGSDFWNGYNVRGVYCRSLKTKQDVYSLINRLNVWSSNHSIYLRNTIGYLLQRPGLEFLPVPPWETDVAGLKVPYSAVCPFIAGKVTRKSFGSIVYSRYTPRGEAISLLSVGSRPMVRKGLIHNPPGILLSAISGYLRNGEVLLRQRFTKYLKRLAVAPGWDYYDPCRSLLTSDGWRNWKSGYVSVNIGSCWHLRSRLAKARSAA